MAKHTIEELKQMQSLTLETKIALSRERIRGWVKEYGEDGVYVSFSGGKDSTVLRHIVHEICGYKNIPDVFVDVPTQYPELKQFALGFENVEVLYPKYSFMEICEKYGFPLVSKEISQTISEVKSSIKRGDTNTYRFKQLNGETNFEKSKWKFMLEAPFDISHQCCGCLKKNPIKKYEKKTKRKGILGTMAQESVQRTTQWLNHGCNGFELKRPVSNPLSFWTEQDILKYIKQNNLSICSVYGEVVFDYEAMGELEGQSFLFDTGVEPLKTTGCKRTGCMLCGFGCHLNNDTRFLQLKQTHEKMYNLLDVVKNNGVTFREAIEWTNEHGNLNIRL